MVCQYHFRRILLLSQAVYSVGTATQTVVAPTHDYAEYVLQNLQPKNVDEMARDGFVFLASQTFTILPGASMNLSMATGAFGAQLDFYTIISDTSTVAASLIEDATITVTGSEIPAYNLNRNKSDSYSAVLKAATLISGGTVVSSELVTASVHAGGAMSSQKVHTLKANSNYGMRFTNQGNQATNVFFQLGFSEQYNGLNTVWLGTPNESFALRPSETIKLNLLPEETINATALHDNVKLSVLRQE